MSRLSLLRDRRAANVSEERKQSFLVFHLGRDLFALPLLAVQKVSLLGTIFGDPQQSGLGVTVHEGQQLAVIDVERRILQRSLQASVDAASAQDCATPTNPRQFLLILQNTQGEMMGLPVDSKPKIQAFTEQSLNPLPPTYEHHAAIHCVSAMMIHDQEQPIFVLNPDLVCQSLNARTDQPTVPSTLQPALQPALQSKVDAVMPVMSDALNYSQDNFQDHSQPDFLPDSQREAQPSLPVAMPAMVSAQPPILVNLSHGDPFADETLDWENLSLDGFELPENTDVPDAAMAADTSLEMPDLASTAVVADSTLDTLELAILEAETPVAEFLETGIEMDDRGEMLAEEFLTLATRSDVESSAEFEVGGKIDWENMPMMDLAAAPIEPEPATDGEIDWENMPMMELATAPIEPELAADGEIDWENMPMMEVAAKDTPLSPTPEPTEVGADAAALDWESLPLDAFQIPGLPAELDAFELAPTLDEAAFQVNLDSMA